MVLKASSPSHWVIPSDLHLVNRSPYSGVLVLLLLFQGIWAAAQAYPFPAIPDSLIVPQERTDYLALHFWDNCDFSDTPYLQEPQMMLDYLYLLQQQTLPQSGESIRELLRRCVGYPKAFSQVQYWFRHFLHDGQSTFFDDERFMLFLEEWLSSPFDDKNEAEYLLNIVRKNRMGQVSEDFSFLTKEGVHQRLREIKAPLLLLYFTSPTCPACHRAQALLERSVTIDRLCDTGMKIAAICPAPEYKAWQTHPFPSAWITGFDDTGAILEDRLYEIQYYPCFYLLDAHGRVLLKEADLDRLEAYLRRFE